MSKFEIKPYIAFLESQLILQILSLEFFYSEFYSMSSVENFIYFIFRTTLNYTTEWSVVSIGSRL